MKLELACVSAFAILLFAACGVSEEEKQALAAEIDAAEAFSNGLETARVEAIAAFVAAPTGVPTECPAELLRGEERLDAGRRAAQNLSTIPVTELADEPSPRAELARSAFGVSRRKLEAGSMIAIENGEQLERARSEVARWADNEFWPHDVTFVMTHRRVPRTVRTGVFEPGYVAGWVVAWSYAEARVVCAFEMREDTPAGVTLENHPDTTEEQELLMYLGGRITTRIRQSLGNL